jgi:two-component system response regulator PhoP
MDLVKQLREGGQRFPILILTARSSWQDKVQGPEIRRGRLSGQALSTSRNCWRASTPWSVAQAAGRGHCWNADPSCSTPPRKPSPSNGAPVDLTSYEYKVLEYLMMHAGELVSKADLTEHIYQQDFDRDSNVLEVFIGRLRRKLDPDNQIKPIETVRGRGYRFALERSSGFDEPAAQESR